MQFPGGPATVVAAAGAATVGRARAVNSSGIVIGHVDSNALSFAYRDGIVTWLQALPGDQLTEALAINSEGRIVGYSNDVFGTLGLQPVAWFNGRPTRLRLPMGAAGEATGINDEDQICGWMGSYPWPTDTATPFIWHNGVTTALPLPKRALNNTGAATALNNLGDACGYFFIHDRASGNFIRQGCAWIDGELIELGVLPGYAGAFPQDINDAREIVGYLTEETGIALVPFIWRDGVMHDLNDLAPEGSPFMSIARAINSRGQITGQAHGGGHSLAFLLTPSPPTTPGDSDCNDRVDTDDLLIVLSRWNPEGPVGGRPADVNRDNRIDAFDLIELFQNWTGAGG